MTIYRLAGAALLLSMAMYLLARMGRTEVGVYAAVGATVLLSVGVYPLREAIGTLLPLTDGVGEEALSSVSKALGIGYISGICSDLCEDLGQAALARALVLGGRAMIFSLCVPYVVSLYQLCEELVR